MRSPSERHSEILPAAIWLDCRMWTICIKTIWTSEWVKPSRRTATWVVGDLLLWYASVFGWFWGSFQEPYFGTPQGVSKQFMVELEIVRLHFASSGQKRWGGEGIGAPLGISDIFSSFELRKKTFQEINSVQLVQKTTPACGATSLLTQNTHTHVHSQANRCKKLELRLKRLFAWKCRLAERWLRKPRDAKLRHWGSHKARHAHSYEGALTSHKTLHLIYVRPFTFFFLMPYIYISGN